MFGRSRPPLRDLAPRRIGLIKPSALGDIVHSLPVLTALGGASRRPTSPGSSTVPTSRFCSVTHTSTRRWPSTAAPGGAACGPAYGTSWSFSAPCDANTSTSSLTCKGYSAPESWRWLAGRGGRVGLATVRERAAWFYTDRVAVPDFHETHAVDRYWLVAEALAPPARASSSCRCEPTLAPGPRTCCDPSLGRGSRSDRGRAGSRNAGRRSTSPNSPAARRPDLAGPWYW